MDMLPSIFLKYAKIFAEHGQVLYMVGGSVRDYLLGLEVRDLDFATPCPVETSIQFLENANARYGHLGVLSVKEEDSRIDIVTFRKESGYVDFRHPSDIVFVKDMYLDSCRRDFSINALYMDVNGNVYDFHEGLKDLAHRSLRFIGDPDIRIQEDPLRILRAERFAKRLGFDIEETSLKAMKRNYPLLDKINPEKVNMERKKE